MIKRISFDSKENWADAPPHARPLRLTVATALTEFPGQRHDSVTLAWFADAVHMRRFENWSGETGVMVEESVARGADWLARRWSAGDKFKHMALAVRADGLSVAEFGRRWRAQAGGFRRPGAAAPTVIPDHARGLAYVQNHPSTYERPYDAVNEVYFDDVEALRTRIEWFRDNLGPEGDALFKESWFLAVRETVVLPVS